MIRWGLALSLPIAPLAAQAQTITFEEARAMPTAALAERLLGASGTLAAESRVYGGAPPFGAADRLYRVEFASAPRSAGFVGLCEADVYTVDLATLADSRAASVRGLRMEQRYRVVDETAPLPDRWNDAYGRALEARCAAAGPVLGPGFFAGRTDLSTDFWPGHAYFAARAFAMARDFGGPIPCSDARKPSTTGLCADPLAIVKGLRPDAFTHVDVAPCKDQPATWCVGMVIPRDPPGVPSNRYIIIAVATDVTRIRGTIDSFTVRGITVEGTTIVN